MTRPFPVDQRDHARTWAIVGWVLVLVFALTTIWSFNRSACEAAYGEAACTPIKTEEGQVL